MKKFLFLLLVVPSLIFAQTSNGFNVSGTISGVPESAVVKLTSTNDSNVVVAKGSVTQGKFVLKGAVPEPALYWLIIGKEKPQYIYLENKNINITGSQKDINNLNIQGSQSHNDFEIFKKVFNPMISEVNGLVAEINKTNDQKKREPLVKRFESMVNMIKNEVGTFVASRPSSYVSPFLLYVTAQMFDDPVFLEQRFNSLNKELRNSQIGQSLNQYIQYQKVGAIGTDAIDFSQPDINGNPVKLSSFKGKYVLIDFWASWCRPCREENPHVVKAFQKFNNKNFTVLGVSLDREKEPWLKAIEKDKLTWTQVSDLQFWSNAAAVMYRVTGIPQNFLVDPNGKIVAKNLRGQELENKLCELLGCN